MSITEAERSFIPHKVFKLFKQMKLCYVSHTRLGLGTVRNIARQKKKHKTSKQEHVTFRSPSRGVPVRFKYKRATCGVKCAETETELETEREVVNDGTNC